MIGGLANHPEREGAHLWFVDDARRMSSIGPDMTVRFVAAPVPGAPARVVTCCPIGEPLAVVASGDVYRLLQLTSGPAWKSIGNILHPKGLHMGTSSVKQQQSPEPGCVIERAWVERVHTGRLVVALTSTRRVYVLVDRATPRPVGGPLPGKSEVLAVALEGIAGATALLASGEVFVCSDRMRWTKLTRLSPDMVAGKARMRVLVGHGAVDKRNRVGDVIEVEAAQALDLVRKNWAEGVDDEPLEGGAA